MYHWIRWRIRTFKYWLLVLLLYRGQWRNIWNAWCNSGIWAIINDTEKDTVRLLYMPEIDNMGAPSDKDLDIEIPYDHFKKLVIFILTIR